MRGTGINLLNPLSGTALRIGENGGNTADQLGIRSLNPANEPVGFQQWPGHHPDRDHPRPDPPARSSSRRNQTAPNFPYRSTAFRRPSQLIAAINSATGNSTVTAALNSTGNGITLTDTTPGSGNLSVAAGSNYVGNGTNLGIFQSGTGGTLTGGNIKSSPPDAISALRGTDGTSFTVSLGGAPPATTVQDVLDRINNADGNTAAATHVTAALNPTGNGIQLSDASSGSGTLTVSPLNASEAAAQLGIYKTAPSATPSVITGDDNNPPSSRRGYFLFADDAAATRC